MVGLLAAPTEPRTTDRRVSRLIWYFIPHALTNIPGDVGWQAYSSIIYLSFFTLTLFD